eukprot:1195672-Prorocentrum_minimum.AAC.1
MVTASMLTAILAADEAPSDPNAPAADQSDPPAEEADQSDPPAEEADQSDPPAEKADQSDPPAEDEETHVDATTAAADAVVRSVAAHCQVQGIHRPMLDDCVRRSC